MLNKRTLPINKYYRRYGVDLWGRIRSRIHAIVLRYKYKLQIRSETSNKLVVMNLSKRRRFRKKTPLPRFLVKFVKGLVPPRYWFRIITRTKRIPSLTEQEHIDLAANYRFRLENRYVRRIKGRVYMEMKKEKKKRQPYVYIRYIYAFRRILRRIRKLKKFKKRLRRFTYRRPYGHPMCKVIPNFDPLRGRRKARFRYEYVKTRRGRYIKKKVPLPQLSPRMLQIQRAIESTKNRGISFTYRLDKGKPRTRKPKRSKFRTLFLARRHLRKFFTSIKVHQLRKFYTSTPVTPKGYGFRYSRIDYFSSLLARRLDYVLFISNFVTTMNQARQYILHKKVLVNNEVVTRTNYRLQNWDSVQLKEPYSTLVKDRIKKRLKLKSLFMPVPSWLLIRYFDMSVRIVTNPKEKQLLLPFKAPARLLYSICKFF